MSNNKPKSSVRPVNQHIASKAAKPNDVVAAANAAQAAKAEAAAKAESEANLAAIKKPTEAPVEAPVDVAAPEATKVVEEAKEPVATESAAPVADSEAVEAPVKTEADRIKEIINTNRKDSNDWAFILQYKIDNKSKIKNDKDLAEIFKVTISNIQQQRNKAKAKKLKAEAEAEAEVKAEEKAKLSPSSMVEDAIELMKGIEEELMNFDIKIDEAKAIVAASATERQKIEERKNKYIGVVDLLGTEEDKAKIKAIAEDLRK